MITFRHMEEEDLNKFKDILAICYDLDLDLSGTFSMYEFLGEPRCLYYDEGSGLIFSLTKKGDVKYKSFVLGEDYKVVGCNTDNLMYEVEGDTEIFTDLNTWVKSSIIYKKREDDQVDRDGFNGVVAFVQYNPVVDKRAVINYQQDIKDYKKKGYVFEDTFKRDPFVISFENDVIKKQDQDKEPHAEKFVRIDTKYGDMDYDIMTIHDYGLVKFLEKGSFELQREKKFNRYYRIVSDDFLGYTISTYPLGKQHKLEDLEERLKEDFFELRPTKEMLDIYNNSYHKDLAEFNEVANTLKELSEKEGLAGSILTM